MDSDAVSSDGDAAQYRLVIVQGIHPTALLYPADANSYSGALFHLRLGPHQPLPRCPSGSLVDVRGLVGVGTKPVMFVAGTEIVPVSTLRKGPVDRMFASKGDVLVHPDVIGSLKTWRFVDSHSFDPIEHWERKLRRSLITFWVCVVLVALAVAFIVLMIATDQFGNGSGGGGGGGGGAAGAAGGLSWLRARRARRALAAARKELDGPRQTMRMRVVWTVGEGFGPIAAATLYEPDDVAGVSPVAEVPLVGIPRGLESTDTLEVAVYGLESGAPVIKLGDQLFWPTEHAQLMHQ